MASDHFSASIGPRSVAECEADFLPSEVHGADIRFHGVVRNWEGDRPISAIRYSCYEAMALPQLEKIGAELGEQYPDHLASVHHCLGEVAAGVASIIIRVQTQHSAEGWEISQEYLRRIKTSVPIWKEMVYV